MKAEKKLWVLAAALVFCAAGIRAQNRPSDARTGSPDAPLPPISLAPGDSSAAGPPAPAARGVSSSRGDLEPSAPQVEPDMHTLSGAELFSVSGGNAHNIFDPSFSVTQSAQSTSLMTPVSTSIFGGQLNFSRIWDRYQFNATYYGGDTISQGSQSSFHNVALEQEITWERWRIDLRDDFLASPGASFGGSGMGGPGLIGQVSSVFGSGLENVSQGFVPSETIQTGQGTRYRNAALAEAEYSFSRRSALTVSGSYGLLHFNDAGFLSSHDIHVQAGYDYLLDPKNSIAVLGGYGKIDYAGVSTTTESYMAAFAYGRKITGRLAFQAAGGPEQVRALHTANGSFQFWTWSANSALTYQRRRTQYTASYLRGLTSGSGVFFGAMTNTLTASVSNRLTRFWTATANAGYGFNRTIARPGIATATFNQWFMGGNIGHPLGRHALINFSYGLIKQNSGTPCPVTNCGGTGLQQTFGMTVNWHLRPSE